jgi:uncharacterized protein (TIGR03382 family)
MSAKITGLAFTLSAVLPLMATAAVPTATCRSTDRPETGMSGETTEAERDAGLPLQGPYKCNADLVGQYQGEGASWQLTAWKNCAYFDQRHPAEANPSGAVETNPGVVVVDVSDPTHPTPTTWLQADAMIDPWESVKVNPARQLLGAGQRPLSPPGYPTSPGDGFAAYDISADCKQPVLLSNVHLPGSIGHTGMWAPDGKTYYVTPLRNDTSIIAVYTDDPVNPYVPDGGIFTFSSSLDGGVPGPQYLALPRLHDLEFSKDGNTAYATMFGAGLGTPASTAAGNGLAILDVSDFQQRRANPQYRVIGQVTWDDGSLGAQHALEILIAGKKYIIFADEAGGGVASCASGKSANGFPRLIDITDPAHPVVTAEIRLGVAEPANCAAIATAPINSTLQPDGGIIYGPGGFAHSCHYCNVDDVDDARILACNCFAAGLRFWDIHDPANIKEMAYFKPTAQGNKVLPGSQYANRVSPPTFVRMYDWATSKPSFPKDRGADAGDVWTTAQDNGFLVINLYSKVTVTPATVSVETNKPTTLAATVDGAAKTAGVNWSIQESSGASVTDAGVFTATTAGTYHVLATSIVDRTKNAAATVSVLTATTPPPAEDNGCSATSTSYAGLLPLAALLGWLLWRRRTSPTP